MRPPGFSPARRTARRVLLVGSERARAGTSAAAFLGTDHPLVRTLDALGTVAMQSRVVGAVVGTSIVAEIAGAHRARAITIGACIALAALALVALALRQTVRDQAVQLILGGRDRLPVPAVQAQCRRLLAPRTRRALARSFESMVNRALHPPNPPVRGAQPIFDVAVVAAVSKELRAVASLLREPCESVLGVALAERLLTHGDSPLYGHDVGLLRDDLGRLQSILRAG